MFEFFFNLWIYNAWYSPNKKYDDVPSDVQFLLCGSAAIKLFNYTLIIKLISPLNGFINLFTLKLKK